MSARPKSAAKGRAKPKERYKSGRFSWRTTGIVLGAIALVILLSLAFNALRPQPPVEYRELKNAPLALARGTWDHFAVVVIDPRTSREQLYSLLEYFRDRYTASEDNTVKIVVVNNQFALLNADENAIVAEYRQDRAKSEFILELKDPARR